MKKNKGGFGKRLIRCLFVFGLAWLYACSGQKVKEPLNRPNVLFIAIDDLNDWQGKLNGNPLAKTPSLDKLSEMGVLFANAHAPMAVCAASRSAVLSGMHPSTSGWYLLNADMEAMNESYEQVMSEKKMLPEFFKSEGYETYCAGKIFHGGAFDFDHQKDVFWDDILPGYKQYLRPMDYERGGGYGGYDFYPFPKGGSQMQNITGDSIKGGYSLCGGPLDKEDIPNGKMYDELIADYAIDQLNKEHEEPFFLSVGFVRPHVPYTAPRKYFDQYNLEDIVLPDVPADEMKDVPLIGKAIATNYGVPGVGDYQIVNQMGESYWRHLIHSYMASVSFVDDQLGRVLTALEKSQHAKNTIIVLWSDHGQSLGEKMNFRKMSLWEESTRVPLIIVTPKMSSAGKLCSKPVGLLDIYPTLVELCEFPKQKFTDGTSLSSLLSNPDASWTKPTLMSWRYKNFAVRSENYRYIKYRDGSEELYDEAADQAEHRNLALDEEYVSVMEVHRKWIPKQVALPVGMDEWEGDEITQKIQQWEQGAIKPDWF